ncbi:hypothetical protein NQZ68_035974 [Dissostichus eleginoides]|nr:hypothetical protein NQZ68_035974 [Dissostichus eleginoides]
MLLFGDGGSQSVRLASGPEGGGGYERAGGMDGLSWLYVPRWLCVSGRAARRGGALTTDGNDRINKQELAFIRHRRINSCRNEAERKGHNVDLMSVQKAAIFSPVLKKEMKEMD